MTSTISFVLIVSKRPQVLETVQQVYGEKVWMMRYTRIDAALEFFQEHDDDVDLVIIDAGYLSDRRHLPSSKDIKPFSTEEVPVIMLCPSPGCVRTAEKVGARYIQGGFSVCTLRALIRGIP